MLNPSSGSSLPPGLRPMQCQTRKVVKTARRLNHADWALRQHGLRDLRSENSVHPARGQPCTYIPKMLRSENRTTWNATLVDAGSEEGPTMPGARGQRIPRQETRHAGKALVRAPSTCGLFRSTKGWDGCNFLVRPRHPSQESLVQARVGDKEKMNCNSKIWALGRLFNSQISRVDGWRRAIPWSSTASSQGLLCPKHVASCILGAAASSSLYAESAAL